MLVDSFGDGEFQNTVKEKIIWIGPPKLTRFEKARVVGARALQIAMGAPILISPPESITNPIDIALKELENRVLPITVRRTLPDGTFQDIPLKWLLGNQKKWLLALKMLLFNKTRGSPISLNVHSHLVNNGVNV